MYRQDSVFGFGCGAFPLHNWRINSAADRPQAAAHCFNFSCSSSFNRTVIGTFRTSFSDFSLLIFLNPPVLFFFLRGKQGLSPERSPHAFRLWIGLWLTQSDARYLCGQRRRAFFLCSGILPYLSYPPKRKSYVPAPPFWI